jgi:signal transduction histidine kinase
MKLVYKIIITLMIPLTVTLGLWGWLSYRTMSEKIHADTDLILKDYSDHIILRLLSGQEMPERFNGVYNTYYIEFLTAEEAESYPAIEYAEAEVMLKSQEEFASSRIRKQIFEDNDGNFRRLTVSMPTFEQEVLIEHVLVWTVLLFGILLVTIVSLGIMLLNYNMRPLYKLLNWIDEYEPGSPASKVPSQTDIVEFRKLATAVQDAVYRFETQYEERKIFIGNASHELQTPLAVCSNRIEMLLDRNDLNEEIAGELVKIHRSLSGLVKLNKTMLLLAKIENGQFPQTSEIDMTTIAEGCIELYKETHAHRNLDVEIDGNTRFSMYMDEQMASVLIGNLIKNAFLYTPQDGQISLTFTENGFSIANSGEAPLDREKVFRRFYQPAGRREGSTGLGLALVYSVCINNGLDISYNFLGGKHIFDIILKKSK